jgi:hypothetical protein
MAHFEHSLQEKLNPPFPIAARAHGLQVLVASWLDAPRKTFIIDAVKTLYEASVRIFCMSLNRRLLLFGVFSIVVVNVVLMVLPWTPKRPVLVDGVEDKVATAAQPVYWRLTTLHQTAGVLTFIKMRYHNDSWNAMIKAWESHREHPEKSVYSDVFFDKGVKFQYPPTSLLAVESVARVTTNQPQQYTFLNGLSYVALWLNAMLVGLIFLRSCDSHLADEGLTRGGRQLRFLLAVGMTLAFYPIVRAAWLGQIQTWLNAGFALVIYLWMLNRPAIAGLVTAVLCAIKPQQGLLLVWAGVRKRWGFGVTMGVAGVVIGAVSVAMYGLQNHFDYLKVISYISKHGEGFFPNQSMNGLLNRLLHNGNNNNWDAVTFAPYLPVVYYGTLISSAVLIVGACWPRGGKMGTASLLIAILSFTMASPIAWEHHYGVLMPIFAWLLPAVIKSPVMGRWTLPVLGVAYVLASNFFGATRALADTGFNFVQSYLYFAAIVVLVMLYRVRRAESIA